MEGAKRPKLYHMEEKKLTLYPVLPEDLTADIPLTEVYVATILDQKETSKIIVELNSVLPIPELMHLKRVKGREVLLFPVIDIKEDQVFSILKDKKFDVSKLEKTIKTTLVAKLPPKVRSQYERISKRWPCNFHSNKYLEKLTTNTLFSAQDLDEFARYMKVSIDVAKYARRHYSEESQVGAVVVDPKINSIVAVGHSRTNEGPCRHATMVAVDNVAKTQKGGCWNTDEAIDEDGELTTSGFRADLLDFLRREHQNLRFGAVRFKGKSDSEYADGPYLCTGYYVFLTHEPCAMCAMALVHSRTKRVFFGAATSNGALSTLCKIHTVRDLNHHYEVFGGLLVDECLRLWDDEDTSVKN